MEETGHGKFWSGGGKGLLHLYKSTKEKEMLNNLRKECYKVSRRLDLFKGHSKLAIAMQKKIDAALNSARGHLDGEQYVKQMRQALDGAETFLNARGG